LDAELNAKKSEVVRKADDVVVKRSN
jgi:hypothetical protein